ncbi:unnamed protein product [Rotaria sp. Silwood2]|nr:unnamed protein product [Rotaria sp. Silwood2]
MKARKTKPFYTFLSLSNTHFISIGSSKSDLTCADISSSIESLRKLNTKTKIEAIKRNIDNENERIEELCIELRFGKLSSKVHLQNNTNPSQSPSIQSAATFVQVTKL